MANRTVSVNLLANIGQYVSGMNSAAAATTRLGQSVQAGTKKAQSGFDLASKASLLMGAAVVGGLALAVNASMQFEKSMSAVAAATMATGSTLTDLRAAAIKAGADTSFSATEAADAITEMAKAGVSAKDIMGGGLKGALSLAAAGQIDVAEAAGIAATAMTQFSLSGKDIPHVADLLAAGAGKAMGSVDDLGMALNQAGLIASASGLSIEETTGTLAAFASAGLLGSDAGTSMKTMLQKLQAPSKEAAGIMSDLGINMYDANGNMLTMSGMAGQLQNHMAGLTQEQRNNALATIFGSDAVRAANVLYAQGADGIDKWTHKVNDAGYAAKQAAALQDNLSGDLEKLGGSFQTLLIEIGSGAQGPLRLLTQGLTSILNGVGDLSGPLAALIGFIADNKEVALALASVLAIQLTGGMAAATVAFNRFLLTPATLGLAGILQPFVALSTLMSGGFVAAAGAARTALLGFMTTAAPLVAVASVIYGIAKVVDFATAAGDARDEVHGMWKAVGDAGAGTQQLEALSGVVDQLQTKIAALNDEIPQTNGAFQGFLSLTGGLDFGSKIQQWDVYEKSLRKAKDAQEEVNRTVADLGAEFHLSQQDVLDLAEKYDVDLTGNAKKASDLFEYMYSKEYGTGPADAANATGSAMASAKAQTEAANTAQEEWLKNLDQIGKAFVDPLATYTGLLSQKQEAEQASAQATADSTKSSKDSWKDYVKDVTVSLDEYATKLEEQLKAQESWRTNIGIITQRGGLEVGQILTDMGVEGAGIAAKMATAMPAEFERLKRDLITEAKGATAGLDTEMKVMAIVGARGAKTTAAGIAAQLNIGVAQVAAIAKKYGVTLASGINPLLTAVGHGRIASINGQKVPDFWDGGFTGAGGKYTPAGIVHKGEFVMPQEAVSRIGVGNLGAMAGLPGYANGGFVSAASVPRPYSTAPYGMPISTAGDATMQREFNEVRAWLTANAAPAFTGGGVSGGNAANRALGQRIAASMGLGGQFPAIDFVFTHESGWNNLAQNPTSTAYGIAQFLNSTWATVGGHKTSDPGLQIQYGLKYMNKYGGPNGAAAFWRQHHWYESGTSYVPETGLAGLHKGEAVLTREQAAAYRTGLRSRETSGGRGGGVAIDYDRLAAAVGSRSTHITAVAAPNEQALANKIVDRQRDLEFLYG